VQQTLFGCGAPSFDPDLKGLRRLELSGGAWVEHQPGWLEGHEAVFRELECSTRWQQQRRTMYDREVDVPRLVARAPLESPVGRVLASLAAQLARRYQRAFTNISVAQYRDGRDSVAFHGDKVGPLVDDCVIATVSVGARRRFLLKPSSGGTSLGFELGWGDLFVMGGACQRAWQHAVPKCAHADPRISIMFRPPLPARPSFLRDASRA
jgi:alkylated DNA repair dioxygenase AlkB